MLFPKQLWLNKLRRSPPLLELQCKKGQGVLQVRVGLSGLSHLVAAVGPGPPTATVVPARARRAVTRARAAPDSESDSDHHCASLPVSDCGWLCDSGSKSHFNYSFGNVKDRAAPSWCGQRRCLKLLG